MVSASFEASFIDASLSAVPERIFTLLSIHSRTRYMVRGSGHGPAPCLIKRACLHTVLYHTALAAFFHGKAK